MLGFISIFIFAMKCICSTLLKSIVCCKLQVAESEQGEVYRHGSFIEDTPPVPHNRSSVTYMLALRKAVMRPRKPGDAEPADGPSLPSWFPRRQATANGERSASPAGGNAGPPRSSFFFRKSIAEEPSSSWYVGAPETTGSGSSPPRDANGRRPSRPPIPPRPSEAMLASRQSSRQASTRAKAPQLPPGEVPYEPEQVYAEPLPCANRSPPPSGVERPVSDGYLVPLPYLVQCCLVYLETPKALSEEGLFRVPGDVTRIRHLKAAFDTLEQKGITLASGRSLTNFLQQEVSKEPDPNTIAGLLKMYLREQTLINAESCKAIVSALYGRQRDRTISNPTQELDLLQLALQNQVPQISAKDAPQRAAELRDILKVKVSSRSRSVLGSVCRLLLEVSLFMFSDLAVCFG